MSIIYLLMNIFVLFCFDGVFPTLEITVMILDNVSGLFWDTCGLFWDIEIIAVNNGSLGHVAAVTWKGRKWLGSAFFMSDILLSI